MDRYKFYFGSDKYSKDAGNLELAKYFPPNLFVCSEISEQIAS